MAWNLIKRVIEWFKKAFCLKCPECGGRMYTEFFDMTYDGMVYKCEECGKYWM